MHIHILGACGTFMGGLALLARHAGHKVTGQDRKTYPPMSSQLAAAGIELYEGYDAAWTSLEATRTPLRSSKKRSAINGLMQYTAERYGMIRYPEFRARHWQIGSGPTEAECKTTTMRVKGRGRRWDSANAEAMMALAALHDSGLWHLRWSTLNPQRN